MTWLVAPAAARSLLLAALAAALLVIGATALRLIPIGVPGPTVSAVVPLLWGAGAVIVLALTRTWAPAVAWGAAIVGATAATLSVIGVGSEVRAVEVIPGPWLDLTMFAALVAPAAIAACLRHRRRPGAALDAWWPAGSSSWRCPLGLVGRSVARAISGEQEGGIPKWLWLLVVALLAAIGVVRDVRPALSRTRERVAAGEAAGRGSRATRGRSCACSWTRWCRAGTSGEPRRSRPSGRASPPTSTRRCCRRSAARSSRRSPAERSSGWPRICDRRWRRWSRCSSRGGRSCSRRWGCGRRSSGWPSGSRTAPTSGWRSRSRATRPWSARR